MTTLEIVSQSETLSSDSDVDKQELLEYLSQVSRPLTGGELLQITDIVLENPGEFFDCVLEVADRMFSFAVTWEELSPELRKGQSNQIISNVNLHNFILVIILPSFVSIKFDWFETSLDRVVTFENILTFIQQNWIKDQLQLSSASDTIWVEKKKIERDTTSWTLPSDENLSQLFISCEENLKDLVYEAILIQGDFLKSVFGGLVSGIFYFQFTDKAFPYNLTVDWKLESEAEESQSLCQTLEYYSDSILGMGSKDYYIKSIFKCFYFFAPKLTFEIAA